MKTRLLSATLVFVLFLGCTACELIQAYNINGSWQMSIRVNDDHFMFTMIFSGTKTGGSCDFSYNGYAYSGIYAVQNKRIMTAQVSGSQAILCGTLDGSFDSSDKMTGTWTNAVDHSAGTWEATRD
ncbi:MAG: hypothetical protein ACYDH3_05735 [Candidatus Aminicenantales bacterium]